MLPVVNIPFLSTAVSTYSLVLTAYFLLALALTLWLAKRDGMEPAVLGSLFAVSIPAAIMGARLLDSLEYWGEYRSLADLFGRHGSSIYGAFFAIFVVDLAFVRWKRLSMLRLLDAGAPAMAFGEAMSRVGCFLNGCCYGVPWQGPWAVTFPPESFAFRDQQRGGLLPPDAMRSLPVHPVQLYSLVLASLLGIWLMRRTLQPHADGSSFAGFLIGYGVLRLAMAPLRVEALASMKLFSVLFILTGVVILLRGYERAPATRLGVHA
jgi:phosphatidylglycerol:prolipoprotein diacylglycerol transferase